MTLTISPELAEEWHPIYNDEIDPEMLTKGSSQKVWWLGKCGHEWEAKIADRSRGSGCPYCSGVKVLSGFNDLATKNPILAKEWNYEKNDQIKPENISPYSNKKVWWKGKCGHEWKATIGSRNQGNGCPYCSRRSVLTGINDLGTINPELSKEWHPTKNGKLSIKNVSAASHQKVWWLGKCGHEWEATIKERNYGTGCPYCSGNKVLVGFNDLTTKKPDLLKEWNYDRNTELEPEEFTCGSEKKVWWKCSKGHEWEASIKGRASGKGCPYCSGIRHPQIRCIETGIIYKYASDARKATGANVGSINKCCKGEQQTSGGYHWEYVVED